MKLSLLKTALMLVILGTNMAHSMIFKLNTRRIAPYVMQACFFSTPWGTSSANSPKAQHITIGKHTVIDPYSDAEKAQMTRFVKPLVMPKGFTQDAIEFLVTDYSGKEVLMPYVTTTDVPTNRYFKELENKNLPPLLLSLEFPFDPSSLKMDHVVFPNQAVLTKQEAQDCIYYLTACTNLYAHDAKTDKKISNANLKALTIHLFLKHIMQHDKYSTTKTKEDLVNAFYKFEDPLLFGSTNDPFAFHIRQVATVLCISTYWHNYRSPNYPPSEDKDVIL